MAEGQKAFVEIDRPSIAEFSVLWLMVVLKRASILGLSYTMNVSYTVSFCCIKNFQKIFLFIRGRQIIRGSTQNPCGFGCEAISCSDVTEGSKK